MEELKKAKLLRFICRLAFFLVSLVIPTVIMITHFEITQPNHRTITTITFYTFIVCFVIFCLIWKFKNRLLSWIENWEYSYMKYILLGLSKVWIYILLLIVIISTHATLIEAANTAAENFKVAVNNVYKVIEYCMIVVCSSQCIAYLIIYPFENKYDNKVRRLMRKNERKEDYKEAINELEGE